MPNFQIPLQQNTPTKHSNKPLQTILLFLAFLIPFSALQAKPCCPKKRQHFQHDIQLQLADSAGFLVEDTEFWVTLDIIKNGPLVTIDIPLINFQTGPISSNNLALESLVQGGYLYTTDGFLPADVRPTDIMPRSIVAASNNGLAPLFSFTQTTSSLPVPPAGYIVQITNAGELQIQCAGTFGNIIPSGPQIVLPCSISYITNSISKVCYNKVISDGATNATQFTSPLSLANGIRDTHFNDAFDGVVAWSWTDNSMVPDKTNGVLNCMVAVGKVTPSGTLQVSAPIQLTDLEAGTLAWCTSCAINRTNPDNIVVSYGQLSNNAPINALLTVSSPDSIAGEYPASAGALFPSPWTLPDSLIVPADPLNADTPLVNDLTGKIALIAADGFQTGSINKCNNAFDAGAIGAIIYLDANNFSDGSINGSPFIPCIAVPLNTGLDLLNNQPATGSAETLNVGSEPTVYRAVSFDGGQTWPVNGPWNIEPFTLGDNAGVRADDFGNIWYGTLNSETGLPLFGVSLDGGVTFTIAYEAPPVPPNTDPDLFIGYDFPQFCFGGSHEDDTYGLYFTTNLVVDLDFMQGLGFIPVSGPLLEDIGAGTMVNLHNNNTNAVAFIAAASDSRVWMCGIPSTTSFFQIYSASTFILPQVLNYKSPGPLDENLAGTWNVGIANNLGSEYGFASGQIAQPVYGFFDNPIIYDNKRQALYTMYSTQSPLNSQNMRIYFVISRNNGQTWSQAIDISNTDFANRGFMSMALDRVTGDLVFGWYDGRNDPSYESVEYFASVIPAKKLDTLVNSIPTNDPLPLFNIPPFTPLTRTIQNDKMSDMRPNHMEHSVKRN